MVALRHFGLVVLAASAAFVLAACGTPQNSFPPVQPAQFYGGLYLNITAPNSDGWHLFLHRPEDWAFAKNGSEPDETFIAEVKRFDLPANITPDGFVALVKQQVEQGENPNRFRNVRTAITNSSERAYPCVRYHATSDDTEARTASGSVTTLKFEEEMLACEHPLLANTGVGIAYSRRGHTGDPQFEKEATDFIAHIQVPPAR